MNFNFELILFYAIVVTGIIAGFDMLVLAPNRKSKHQNKQMPAIVDYARSFFPILLLVFLLRAFLFEPFHIPSGSLEPTLLTGDFVLVNKYHYGLRLPVLHYKVFQNDEPQRGDIIVFRWPPNPSYNFIKRVIGIPGDQISYVNKELYINGEKIPQEAVDNKLAQDERGSEVEVLEKEENLLGVKHKIYVDPAKPSRDYNYITVPKGMYFVMGDNRDDSADSRIWGFVPEQNILGKATLVWMSWNNNKTNVRWNRIGGSIH